MRYLIAGLVLLAGSVWGQEIPEEPVMIEADLQFTDGSGLICLFVGEVEIGAVVTITGCPSGPIECDTLDFATINGFAPFVAASGCVLTIQRDGFEKR